MIIIMIIMIIISHAWFTLNLYLFCFEKNPQFVLVHNGCTKKFDSKSSLWSSYSSISIVLISRIEIHSWFVLLNQQLPLWLFLFWSFTRSFCTVKMIPSKCIQMFNPVYFLFMSSYARFSFYFRNFLPFFSWNGGSFKYRMLFFDENDRHPNHFRYIHTAFGRYCPMIIRFTSNNFVH